MLDTTKMPSEPYLYAVHNLSSLPKMNNIISVGKSPEVKEYYLRRPFQREIPLGYSSLDFNFDSDSYSYQFFDSVTLSGMVDPYNQLDVLENYEDVYEMPSIENPDKTQFYTIGMKPVVGYNKFKYELVISVQGMSTKIYHKYF